MIRKLLEKKLERRKLTYIAVTFAALFCASGLYGSIGVNVESEERRGIAKGFERLPHSSREAADIEILYFSGHGLREESETNDRADRIIRSYQAACAILAHEIGHITKENGPTSSALTFAFTDSLVVARILDNSPDGYFYERLLLEKRRQEGLLSSSDYDQARLQLAQVYLSISRLEVPSDKQALTLRLEMAEKDIAQMQSQVASLKEQLSQAQQSQFEKRLVIMIGLFSLLIALSSNIIAWRTDRRQSRDAELINLKRLELQQSIIHTNQQIRERNENIIKPSVRELQLYAKPVRPPRNDVF